MAFGAADMQHATPVGTMPRELSHDLRTPLTVIRMQAQLLLRTTRRGGFAGGTADRDRLLIGLQRIDDAVTKLTLVLDRIGIAEADDRPGRHERSNGRGAPEIH